MTAINMAMAGPARDVLRRRLYDARRLGLEGTPGDHH